MEENCGAGLHDDNKCNSFFPVKVGQTVEEAAITAPISPTVNSVLTKTRKRKDWEAIASEGNSYQKRVLRSNSTKLKLQREAMESDTINAGTSNLPSHRTDGNDLMPKEELSSGNAVCEDTVFSYLEESVMERDALKDGTVTITNDEGTYARSEVSGELPISQGCVSSMEIESRTVTVRKEVHVSSNVNSEESLLCQTEIASCNVNPEVLPFRGTETLTNCTKMEIIYPDVVEEVEKTGQGQCFIKQTNLVVNDFENGRDSAADDSAHSNTVELGESAGISDVKAGSEQGSLGNELDGFMTDCKENNFPISACVLGNSFAKQSRAVQRLKCDHEVVMFEARMTRLASARQREVPNKLLKAQASGTRKEQAMVTKQYKRKLSSGSSRKRVSDDSCPDLPHNRNVFDTEKNDVGMSDPDKEVIFKTGSTRSRSLAVEEDADIDAKNSKQSIHGKRAAVSAEGQPTKKKNRVDQLEDNCSGKNLSKSSKKGRRNSLIRRRSKEEIQTSEDEEEPETLLRLRVRSHLRNGNIVKSYCRTDGSKSISSKGNVVQPKEANPVRKNMGKRKGSELTAPPELKNLRKSPKEFKRLPHRVERKIVASPEGKKSGKTSNSKLPSLSSATNPEIPLSERKQIIRDHIKDILLGHGWTIDFRHRNGRDYEDAVYLPPKGKGSHWSITKAYYAFLSDMSNGQDEKSKSVPSFTPIPEELMLMLKKTMVKKRGSVKDKLGKFDKKSKRGRKSKPPKLPSKDTKPLSLKKLCHGTRAKKRGYVLRARGQNQKLGSCNDDYIPYEYKRTTFSWMIDLEVVPENALVSCMDQYKKITLLEGLATRDGIRCSCCQNVLSAVEFASHAESMLNNPYQHIYVEESGLDLLQCLIQAWEKQFDSEKQAFIVVNADGDDGSDDTCGICGDGGDLICCDNCPSTFHLNCLGLQLLPADDWHCMKCLCKYCEDHMPSPSEQKEHNISMVNCYQCKARFHQACASVGTMNSCIARTMNSSFCQESCLQLFEGIQNLLAGKKDVENGYSLRLVQRLDETSQGKTFSLYEKVECNSKIAVAHAILEECFLPIFDQRSGINLIRNVVYNCGSNFPRLDFRSFYTFILEKGDEVVSVASVRLHGTRLAEMPFIGTRNMYRRQGMCRRLLAGIESILCSLDVEKLTIPAISELVDTWTGTFGFQPLECSDKQEIRSIDILVFPGVDLLQKALINVDANATSRTSDVDNHEDISVGLVECHDSELPNCCKNKVKDSTSRTSVDNQEDVDPDKCHDSELLVCCKNEVKNASILDETAGTPCDSEQNPGTSVNESLYHTSSEDSLVDRSFAIAAK